VILFRDGAHAKWHVEEYVKKVAFCRLTNPFWLSFAIRAFNKLKRRLQRRRSSKGNLIKTPALGQAATAIIFRSQIRLRQKIRRFRVSTLHREPQILRRRRRDLLDGPTPLSAKAGQPRRRCTRCSISPASQQVKTAPFHEWMFTNSTFREAEGPTNSADKGGERLPE
jgi:hypothetical protein